ncbi:hypothetical protein L873DRAFT_1847919 [Choiromyces venosus 120613-1]|uniref:Uncharacterized protein n=1 Tax=Choiromyces venosus 120613-1 TaxID=1336337 RepID=A0A3N4J195_9PEZI|nr:hypothetical protein L873DRAFT_1847919 [Choiromyces venosus 120613-1]
MKTALEMGLVDITHREEILVFIKMLDIIQADYRRSIDRLQEEIDVLNSELDQLRVSPLQLSTTESPPDTHMASESTSALAQQPSTSSAPALATVGAPSWATVIRKGKKKTATQKPAPAAKPPSPTNAPAPKKGITLRERELVIKRDGSPLTPTAMELRDTINSALCLYWCPFLGDSCQERKEEGHHHS